MPNVNSMFPSKYLKAADLPVGRHVGVTIEEVTFEEVQGQGTKKNCPIVYFQGKEKGVVLNRTNANMIAEIAGSDETEQWRGVRISLFSTKVDFQGRRVDAIRIDYPQDGRRAQPTPTPRQQPPEKRETPIGGVDIDPNDDIPF